jgi:hypothetical protein
MNKQNSLKRKYCIISVIGSHAGESVEEIFDRKIKDIKKE